MGKIRVKVDDKTYDDFKNFVYKKYGKSKKILNKKMNEAIENWLKYKIKKI